jgi:hypothetical protein
MRVRIKQEETMKKSVRPLLGALIIILAAGPFVEPQTKTPGAFVEVTVTPKLALAGQPVVISGKTGYHEKKDIATVKVKHDSGEPAKSLTAKVSKDGAFSVTFSDTNKAGKYSVIVTAPDGKGEGQAEFEVSSVGGLADKLEHAFQGLDDRAGKLLKQAEEIAVALPASGERDELIKMIDEVQGKHQTLDLPPVEILGELRRVVQGPTVVYLPEQKIFGQLQDWVEEAEETTEEIDHSKVLDRSKDSICETINTAIEGCKFAALAFNVGKTGLETLANVFVDKAIPAAISAIMGDNAAALGVSSGLKSAAAGLKGKTDLINSIPGLVLDIVEFGVKQLYDRYCGSYQCPIKVKMTMVWNEGAKPWLRYSIYLEGRLTLRFPLQSAPGQAIPMTGDVEGNAVKHEFWEDIFVVEPLPKTVMLLNRAWLPPPAFPLAVESPLDMGSIARTVTPASFNVPLIAEMTGDAIKLQFKPARVDFSPLMVHRTVLVVFTGLIPDFMVFKAPIQPAFWILTKGFGDPWVVELQKDSSGKRFLAKTFTSHRETGDKGVVVDWQISLDSRKKSVKELGGN